MDEKLNKRIDFLINKFSKLKKQIYQQFTNKEVVDILKIWKSEL